MPPATPLRIDKFELDEKLGALLPSQHEFVFAPERFGLIAGGYASGKSRAGVTRGLILSAVIPGNVGWIMRYRGTDIEDSTKPMFFEVCPQDWIRSYNKHANTVVLRNNSVIQFRHLHDANSPMKSRRAGANLGWAFIDQIEECEEEHWNMMVSRVRKHVHSKLFAAMNPNGHDWLWAKSFTQFKPWPEDAEGKVGPMLDGKFYQTFRSKSMIAIAVNSEENRISNGGFVGDDYFDSELDQYSPEIVARMVHCSFDDYHGKLYKEYEAGLKDDGYASVHNIEPFDIPASWNLVTGIDVGGDSPWAIVPNYIDEEGNLIVVPGYHARTARIIDPANWIKNNLPYNESRATFKIDPENKTALVELSDYGVYCQVAQKEVVTAILRVNGYLHVKKGRKLPQWYLDTQPQGKITKFQHRGAPKLYVFKTAGKWREEHDEAKWDAKKPDHMMKTSVKRYDSVEAQWYATMSRPEASTFKEKLYDYSEMSKLDPLSAREWKSYDKRTHEYREKFRGGAGLRESDILVSEENFPRSGRFDLGAKGEM